MDGLAWNPNPEMCLLAVATDHNLFVTTPRVYNSRRIRETDEYLLKAEKTRQERAKASANPDEAYCKWEFDSGNDHQRIKLSFQHVIFRVQWHAKGEYFATMAYNV